MNDYPVRTFTAPLTPRGYVEFVNIRPNQQSPQMWFCDECGGRVPEALQQNHAYNHYLRARRDRADT